MKISRTQTRRGFTTRNACRIIRTKYSNPDINNYFCYFSASNINGLEITNKKYNIISLDDNLYQNYAYIEWILDRNKIITCMNFLYKKHKINNNLTEWKILNLTSYKMNTQIPKILKDNGDLFNF